MAPKNESRTCTPKFGKISPEKANFSHQAALIQKPSAKSHHNHNSNGSKITEKPKYLPTSSHFQKNHSSTAAKYSECSRTSKTTLYLI